MNQVTGATAVAPRANQGLDLNCKLLVAGLYLYSSLQCTARMQAVAGLQQLTCVLTCPVAPEPLYESAAFGQAFVRKGRD